MHILRVTALLPIVTVAIYGGGCSKSDDHGREAADATLADMFYEPHAPANLHEPLTGGPTDDAAADLLATKSVSSSPKAAVVDAPTAGATVPASAIFTFSWHVGAAGGVGGQDGGIGDAATGWLTPSRQRPDHAASASLWALALLGGLVGSERAAYAHLTPYNGTAHLLVFSTSSNDKLLRVFTSKTSYTPDDGAWTTLKGAAVPITLTLTTASFTDNRVDTDGGPFTGTATTFSIKP